MDGMPSRETIMRWEESDKNFATSVACARAAKYEDDIEELEEINEAVKTGALGASEATVVSNNLKWVASRLLPKKYGDKIGIGQAEGLDAQKHDVSLLVKFVGADNG
jgi:hypothetical protein